MIRTLIKSSVIVALFFLSILPLFPGGIGESTFFEDDITIEDGREVSNRVKFIRPRRMIFLFDAPRNKFSDLDRFLVYNSIITEISDANPDVVVLESKESGVPNTFEGKQELARQVDADSWVMVSLRGSVSDVTFYMETFDLLSLKRYGEKTIETGLRLDYRAISRGFWSELAATIHDNYESLVDELDVSITALPGTVVRGLPGGALEMPDQGEVVLKLQNPATYTYRAEFPGYYTIQDDFYLGYERFDLEIDQKEAVSWGVETLVNNMQFLGFQGYYFPIPADVFVKFGVTSYSLGFYLIEDSPNIVRSNSLTAIQLHGGMYFGDLGDYVRPYAAAGMLVRFAYSSEYVGFETSAPLAASLLGGIEYSLPSRDFRVFIEYNPLLYFSEDAIAFRDNSFPMYLYPDDVVPGYIFTDTLALDYRNIVFGIRYCW